MIPYVEIVGKYTLEPFALVEPSECWFEVAYYEKGEFEVYAPATINNLNALKNGNYVKIPHQPYLWIIKSVEYAFNNEGARVISAKGYEAKWLLNTRCILAPVNLSTNLATAVYNLVYNNLGPGALSYRKIVGFIPVLPSYSITIEETQASRENLGEFIETLLKSYACGSYSTYENGQIRFYSIQGQDKTSSVLFSQSMDNLLTASYYESSEEKRTFCRVVSTFNENDQDVEYIQDYNLPDQPANIDRLEMVVNSNLSTELEDGTKVEPSSALYQSWQQQEGKNQLAEKIIKKEFSGEIDLNFSQYKFVDPITQSTMDNTTDCFFIGDLVKVRDEFFGYEESTRVLKYRFKQDSTGYGEEIEYGTE